MGVVLALAAAAAYGLSDFVGGVASRRTSPWPVALLSTIGGFVGAVALASQSPEDPTRPDLLWGALAGVGAGSGTAFLYRGLAAGKMGVVGPISAVGAALLPVAVGFALGERPAVLVWCGIALALPGIWLVAREPATGEQTRIADGLTDGVLAGLGFGVLFVALGQVPASAGHWPLAATQGAATLTVAAMAVVSAAPLRPTVATAGWGFAAGLLGTAALLSFALATQTGLLTVAAVLTSLYPGFTVLLAWLVLRERVHGAQWTGLLLCVGAVSLVAAG